MSDRLNELRRQRALVAEQLAWLDREISAAAGAPPAAPVAPAPVTTPAAPVTPRPEPVSAPTPPATVDPEVSTAVAADADSLLDEYRVAPEELKTDVKKGCFLYFFAALALLALVVIGLYFFFRHGQ